MASSYLSAPTCTSDSHNGYQYDVFINHRGPDVKKTFASHLYHRLDLHRLRVFLDQEELQKGDNLTPQIKGAIGTATVHVAIFSTNYCESHWCLDELLLMLKSKQESGSTIIPVFYHVKPSELRRPKGGNGVYARALRTLEEKETYDSHTRQNKLRYDLGTIEKWRQALSEHHKDVKARVLGIVGHGGIGKTTLAKQFFNRERSKYPCSCFLFDVRASSLKSLQGTLLHDLTPFSKQIKNTAEGIEKLRKHLSSSRAFIILDDVDNNDQLDALLLPARDVLDSKSLILVTSRHKDVLTSWGIEELSIYKLQGLNRQHSKELFCWHAFHQPHPVAIFGELVDKFLKACNGLPLSLKVIGALLYGKKDLENWEAQLLRISKILPADIRNTLKISYDSLEEDEKHIFLDIACFFIGEDKHTAIRIWNGCELSGRLGLQKLDDMCLVELHRKKCTMLDPVLEVDGKECIKMHDHLRELGRYLAEKEPLRRVWRQDVNLSPNSLVRGITNFAQCSPSVADMSDWQLRRLQLLSAEGCVDKVFRDRQLPQLIWLRWSNCPYSSLPCKFPMKNLRVLCVKGSKLNRLWQNESQVPLKLRELHIATDGRLKIPKSIGKLKHLEKIVLEPDKILQTLRLETFPSEFCYLQSLKHLELRSCSKLKSLPDSLCRLTNLQHINLYECYDLQMLPDDFGKLTELRHLRLTRSRLQAFPDSFANLRSLQHIDLKFTKFKSIPESFWKLTNLQHIDLSYCSRLKMIPSSYENLINLRYVDLSHCSSLEMIPPSWLRKRNLEIRIHECSRLKRADSNKAATFHVHNDNSTLKLSRRFPHFPHTFHEKEKYY